MLYHEDFLRTQELASELAKNFNDAIDDLVNSSDKTPMIVSFFASLPRIVFIEPLVVELTEYGAEKRVLIEPFLEGPYTKYSSNMGYVDAQVSRLTESNRLITKEEDLGRFGILGSDGLDAIEEVSEGESESEEEEEEEEGVNDDDGFRRQIFDGEKKYCAPDDSEFHCHMMRDEFWPQAFSHFTYEKSKKRLMVVDLQGVLTKNNDGTKVYQLTDPVIHKHRKRNTFKNWNFGRTDRGEKGMRAFFESHVCNDACRMLNLTPVNFMVRSP